MTPSGWRFAFAVFSVLLSLAAVTLSLALAVPTHRPAIVVAGGLAAILTLSAAIAAWVYRPLSEPDDGPPYVPGVGITPRAAVADSG